MPKVTEAEAEALLDQIDALRLPGMSMKVDWSAEAQAQRTQELGELVKQAQLLGIMPSATTIGNPNSVFQMVRGYGARWFNWRGPFECRHCNVDLRDQINGPPFKREIGMYDDARDRTSHFVCPDCKQTL